MRMKAAVLYQIGEHLVIDNDIEIPPLNQGQVLVKIFVSGICHSQLMEVRGKRGQDKYLPHLLGHEATGEVIDVGYGVTKVKKGDYVVLTWIKGEGMDVPGAEYRKGDIIIHSGGVTTFNEYSVISENRCLKLPEEIPKDVGALFGCALPTGAGIVINSVKPEKGSSIAVFGLGGIGLSALMALKLFDCTTVIAVDVESSKLELAKEFGATHLINGAEDDSNEKILEITKGIGVDYSIEAAGFSRTIEIAFQSVRKEGGLCVFASHPAYNDKIKIDPFDLICGKQIRGSWGGESKPDRDIPQLVQLYLDGKLPIEKLITHRFSLDEINQALDYMENRKATRSLIEISN